MAVALHRSTRSNGHGTSPPRTMTTRHAPFALPGPPTSGKWGLMRCFTFKEYTMRLIALLLLSLFMLSAHAADYAREQRWAEEVVPSLMVGDAVWLEIASGHKFLTLYTEADNAKAGVIVVHGMGVHPDWGLIAPLRQELPEHGYATLSVQMPVLRADAKGEEYAPVFPEAVERLKVAVDFLAAKGYRRIALVTHSLGSRMAARYLQQTPDAPVAAWVAIGPSEALDYSRLKMPVLDLYGENDLPGVLKTAKQRAASLRGKRGSTQVMSPKADHFFNGREAQLLGHVREFLGQTVAP